MKRVLVLNGPNLDKLGTRQPEIYGTATLADIERSLRELASGMDLELAFEQSGSEEALIGAIKSSKADGIIINPAAFSHFSYVLADALRDSGARVIEVHLSNIHAREAFRRVSVISPVAAGVVCGLGADGYRYALQSMAGMLSGS